MAICIYAPNTADFSNNGYGILTPMECTIEEQAGGMYELKLVHPIDADGRWMDIQQGCMIKAPAPVRESPLYEIPEDDTGGEETVVRKIYKANTPRMYLRKEPKANTTKLCALPHGAEVVLLEHDGGKWARVTKVKGGETGYCPFGGLTYVREQEETITGTQQAGGSAVQPEQSRDQLFRIYSIEQDTEAETITAMAMHVFYDMRGNIVNGDYNPESVEAAEALKKIDSMLLNENPFSIHAEHISGKVSGEYGWKNPVECLLDPDTGIAVQTGALLMRDNYDVFLLPDKVRDRGVTIRRGKNLIGVTTTTDDSDAVTRIIPVGKDEDGEPLYIDEVYVDSPRIDDYPYIRAARIEYDVSVGDPDEDNADRVFRTETLARAELKKRAEKDFEDGTDLPEYSMEVDFVLLQNTADYENFASLQAVHMYDTVTVIDEMIGLKSKVRATGYTWDCIARQYESVKLGALEDVQRTVYSFNLPDGSVSGNKITPGSLHLDNIADGSISYSKLSQDAVDRLTDGAQESIYARLRSGRTAQAEYAPGTSETEIRFETAYAAVPNVTLSIETDGNAGCAIVPGSISASGFRARIMNAGEAPVNAALNWIAF